MIRERELLRKLALTLAMVCASAAPASAVEGMWTFDNFPTARMRDELGWSPDQSWLDRTMRAAARLPACSASVVSGEGLILTNHHCVTACIAALSNEAGDHLRDGFAARTRAEESRCPGLYVDVLAGVDDVTSRIDAAAADAEEFARSRDAEVERIEDECSTASTRCEVVTLYQGGRYALYRYRRYGDVRLVFAPEQAMAAFGGDADNFTFPRFGADFAFLRAYAGDAPARTPAHLSLRFSPVEAGEIVLAIGNPGSTSRLRTRAELEFERDVNLPWRLAMLGEQRRLLQAFAARGPRESLVASTLLQTVENSYKALSGRRQALSSAGGFARVAAQDADLQARVRRNLAAQRETGDPWGDIGRAEAAYRTFYLDHQLLEARAGERSELFALTRDIVRGVAERARPEGERLPRYAGARLAAIAAGVRAPRRIEPELEEISLLVWLDALRDRFPAATEIGQRVFAGETPEDLSRRLSLSRIGEPEFRTALWEGGAAAVAAADDPLVILVRNLDEAARAVRRRFTVEVEAPIALAQERLARARFRAFETSRYPDATFSPRVSFGRVEGWREGETDVAPFTTVAQFIARAGADAPQRWRAIGGDTQFNFTSSVDVIAGNSGGPLLDREGRVIGAVFDGNLHSLGGEYYYDPDRNRAIAVSSALIRDALVNVYGMSRLVSELQSEH